MNQGNQTEIGARRDEGYLLIEVLVAAALLLVALLAIMPLFTIAVRQNSFAKDLTVATSLAYDKAEEFARWDCKSIRRSPCCGETQRVDSSGNCPADRVPVEGITFLRTCTVRMNVLNGTYTDDVDALTFPADVGTPPAHLRGLAQIEVLVRPQRSSQFHRRSVKPAIASTLRVCEVK